MGIVHNVVSDLTQAKLRIGRVSVAEEVADVLRERIIEGLDEPGKQLLETEIAEQLDVSRNTLREAFRLLGHERLLEHRRNRGVFVRRLSVADVRDLYRVRRVIEVAAVRHGGQAPPAVLTAIKEAVAEAERAAEQGDWKAVGTANSRFHQALVALNQSPRLDESMRHLLAELRLVFHVMKNHRSFHEPFVARNRELLGLIAAGRSEEAARYLESYLDEAERMLLRAYEPTG